MWPIKTFSASRTKTELKLQSKIQHSTLYKINCLIYYYINKFITIVIQNVPNYEIVIFTPVSETINL